MRRAGQVKTAADRRRCAHLHLPAPFVNEVLETTGRASLRHRLLLAQVVVYFDLAVCLWTDEDEVEVARLLVGGLRTMAHWSRSWRRSTSGAITQARARLGSLVPKRLVEQVAAPMSAEGGAEGGAGSWWRGWRLVAIDATVFDLSDAPTTEEHFGWLGSARGVARPSVPSSRLGRWRSRRVRHGRDHRSGDRALHEWGDDFRLGVARPPHNGPCTSGETTLARSLLELLDPDMLLLADRGFPGYELWEQAAAIASELHWWTKANAVLAATTAAPDGSYRSALAASRGNPGSPITVRVCLLSW